MRLGFGFGFGVGFAEGFEPPDGVADAAGGVGVASSGCDAVGSEPNALSGQ